MYTVASNSDYQYPCIQNQQQVQQQMGTCQFTNANEIDEKDKMARRQSMLDNTCIRNRMFQISENDEIDVGGLYLDENEQNTVHLAS